MDRLKVVIVRGQIIFPGEVIGFSSIESDKIKMQLEAFDNDEELFLTRYKSDNEDGVEVILWHYDADYEFLNDPNIERVIIIGPRSKDIYVRALLAGIDSNKLFVFENQKDAYNYITIDKVETLFLLNDMYIEKEASELKEHILETFNS